MPLGPVIFLLIGALGAIAGIVMTSFM